MMDFKLTHEQMVTARQNADLLEKASTALRVDRTNVPEKLKAMVSELAELKQEIECLQNA